MDWREQLKKELPESPPGTRLIEIEARIALDGRALGTVRTYVLVSSEETAKSAVARSLFSLRDAAYQMTEMKDAIVKQLEPGENG